MTGQVLNREDKLQADEGRLWRQERHCYIKAGIQLIIGLLVIWEIVALLWIVFG